MSPYPASAGGTPTREIIPRLRPLSMPIAWNSDEYSPKTAQPGYFAEVNPLRVKTAPVCA